MIEIRYLTYEEHTYLYQLFEISREGIATYLYYRQITDHTQVKSLWNTHTQNAYQTVIIKDWCKLFGARTEETHYKKLLTIGSLVTYIDAQHQTEVTLRQELLKLANMPLVDFEQYWEEMKSYRDEYLIHTQHNPASQRKGNHPELEPAYRTFKALHTLLHLIFEKIPKSPIDDQNTPFQIINYSTDQLLDLYQEDLKLSPIAYYFYR